jgi:hypothetical protein
LRKESGEWILTDATGVSYNGDFRLDRGSEGDTTAPGETAAGESASGEPQVLLVDGDTGEPIMDSTAPAEPGAPPGANAATNAGPSRAASSESEVLRLLRERAARERGD